jgi:hypothetical protein
MAKKFIVRAETKNTELAGVLPKPAVNVIPQWYKDLPLDKVKVGTDGLLNSKLKKCTPFLDAMTAGYMVTLSDDVFVEYVNGTPKVTWRGTRTIVSPHTVEQTQGFPIPAGYVPIALKWQNEFSYELPKGYSFWCTHPANRLDLPFLTLTGLVDVDSYNLAVQFPFFLKEGFEGIIEAGTPLAQLIPIKRENWEIKRAPLDEDLAYSRYEAFRKKINRSYKSQYWSKKSYK